MRMRNPKDKDILISNCDFFYNGFSNDHPIHVEIGMGKGDFLINMALQNPNLNFIGLEKYSSIVARALKKLAKLYC